jgi:very-short-patch-repair endonuclease
MHSNLERRYAVNVERAHGMPSAVRQAKVVADGRTRYLDNFYEEAQLAVELDGRAAHPAEQRRADNERDNALATLGIVTVRYSWTDVTTRPCLLAAQLAQLLQLRGTAVQLRRCGPSCTAVI